MYERNKTMIKQRLPGKTTNNFSSFEYWEDTLCSYCTKCDRCLRELCNCRQFCEELVNAKDQYDSESAMGLNLAYNFWCAECGIQVCLSCDKEYENKADQSICKTCWKLDFLNRKLKELFKEKENK